MKQKTFFDILNDITFNKIPWKDQDQKLVQPYMINRWFSMSNDYLDLIAELQPMTDMMAVDQYYEFYRDLLPKKKFFVKYIKSQVEKDSKTDALIAFLSQRMEMSKTEVLESIDFISNDDLKNYIRSHGFSDKQIKNDFGV